VFFGGTKKKEEKILGKSEKLAGGLRRAKKDEKNLENSEKLPEISHIWQTNVKSSIGIDFVTNSSPT
jgi:hypothetical protein